LFAGLTPGRFVAAQEKPAPPRGAEIRHPIYWALEKDPSVEAIGDNSSRPAIVYIVRLEAGEQLVATMTTTFDANWGPEPFTLNLFDDKTTSLMGSGTTWLVRVPAKPFTAESAKSPSAFIASFTFASPVSADYYIVPAFKSAGVFFTLKSKTDTVIHTPSPTTCVVGPVSTLSYTSSGEDSLISDITVGEAAKAGKPYGKNRRFCLKQACAIRPPTSLVLTYKLQEALRAKKEVKACWDSSSTIVNVD
jgi:hypothetical protein